tara:strand:+ start:376 stop:1950 length:1575 start_codon:yes stop_codon:yes gene_type:complete
MSAKKIGKPLGGIGAENMQKRKFNLVLDDRLLSKQYVKERILDNTSNEAYGSDWANEDEKAPTKQSIFNYLNTLSVTSDNWVEENNDNTGDLRLFKTGNVGIGNGNSMAFGDVTHKLTVDGDIRATDDFVVKNGATFHLFNELSSGGKDTAILTLDASSSGSKFGSKLAIGTANPDLPFEVSLTGSILTAADGTGIAQFGADSGTNMGISGTEIQARTGGGGATLQLNTHGGAILMGSSGQTTTNAGHMIVNGNLTVNGTATAIHTTETTINDNIIVLNNDVVGSPTENAGIEVERGLLPNVALRWNETDDKWQVQAANGTYNNIVTSADTHVATVVSDSTGLTSFNSSTQTITVNDKFVKNDADDEIAGHLTITKANNTALTIVGANSAQGSAVSITGHLSADTKSFNIPHPLDPENKRLVYGCLEGPEYGMYNRGTEWIGDDTDERYKDRMIGIELPDYWYKMVGKDYTISLTAYGNYNVWIAKKTEDGFWVKTDASKRIRFDWSVIGGRQDAKLEVEQDAR